MSLWILLAALWVALAVDRWWGEPAPRWHPVVWMGHYLVATGRRIAPGAPTEGVDWRAFWAGGLAWSLGLLGVLLAANLVMALISQLPGWGQALVLGLALKPMLAWRMLASEVTAVEAALAVSLDAGRARLAQLVSRDVSQLSAPEVRESAIESLAENLNDSVVAPLFWFVLLGLPGAAAYRFANTADAMWGYRGLRGGRYWTWAGKWAARADDVLSWLPARLTAVAIAVMAGGLSPRVLAREAQRTPSPNGGWPMAAMALALGVCLRKPGAYRLNEPGREARPQDMQSACILASKVVVALALSTSFALVLIAKKGSL
ncbi:MAG: cobalamin biosynthesis protein CobD [Ramlibacter sp.]|nr:cobalamin biosynthesis protein CobD [Ramlibacter sp.]